MSSVLRPFKVKPYIVWTAIIILLACVLLASTQKSFYQARASMKEVVYDEPTTNANGPPTGTLGISPADTIPTQIPADAPIPPITFRPDLFPQPSDTMKDYDHVNLALEPLDRSHPAVSMVSIGESETAAMYPATLDDLFNASQDQGFMESSVDTIYDVLALTPPRLMTDQV